MQTSMIPDDFARFLKRLSSDAEEAGRIYTRLHRGLARYFSLKGISDPVAAADDAIDRAAVKMIAGAVVPDVGRYCLGFARNIARERWRLEQREASAFHMFVESIANDSDEEIERIQHILKPCFDQLNDEEQQLLLEYCRVMSGRARAENRRRMADGMKITVQALRMHVTRLRAGLTDCVRNHSNGNRASN